MKACLKILLCLMVMALAHFSARAQVPAEAEGEFERAVGQYTVNYRELMTSRGVSGIREQRRRSVSLAETQREISNSFLLRGAPPLAEFVTSPSLNGVTNALRESYPANTALIFYAYSGETLQVWLITQAGLSAFSSAIVPQQKLEAAIYDLRSALGVNSLQTGRAPELREAARPTPVDLGLKKIPAERAITEVTELLLPTLIAEQLSTVRHLIVAPILGLGTVPFAILRPFKADAFLIEKMSVSIVPSLFDIEASVQKWKPRYQHPLVIGNPYLPPDGRWRVPPLPGAEDEAFAIARLINTKPLTGRRATKRAVTARASGADFLYFATHGIANSDDPLTGGFLFLSARNLARGFWTAQEVQNQKLTAQIAVLSACQTGLGKIHDAGVIGLSRAFQIAGVPRVVMSLWNVNDQATAELMKAFVRYLKTHVPAEALRLAMLDVKKRRPALSHWASFVMFGTPR